MKKYISIIAVILAVGISSCKKDFLSLEVNPNNPSVTTPQLTLAGTLTQIPNLQINDYNVYQVWAGYLSWNGGIVPPAQLFEYTFQPGDYSPAIWNDWYVNASNLDGLIKTASADPSLAKFEAIAMIMKAYDFQQLVDNFSDVPYSQAFQPSTILFPKYDKGADIYTDLGKQLNAAIALIASSGGATDPGASDVMFGGDMAKWSQFANTLHLRLAIRESNLQGFKTAPALAAGLPAAGSGYLTTDALLNPGYQAKVALKQNPLYTFGGEDENGNPTGTYYRANAFAIKFLQDNDTLRLHQIFATALPAPPSTSTTPVYYGNVYGQIAGILGTKYVSGDGPGLIISATQSALVMQAAESYFLQCEAAYRGYISGDAASLYKLAIEASYAYLGLSLSQADVYVTNHPFTPASNSNAIQLIIQQKWIALCDGYDSFEQFNEYRRTGYPVLPSSVDNAALSTHLPTRLFYPQSELDANPDAYKAAGGLTLNPFTSTIFWDVPPTN